MKKTATMVWMAAIVFLVSLGILGMGTVEAVEEHHGQETQAPAPGGAGEKGHGMMRGSGGGPGAMRRSLGKHHGARFQPGGSGHGRKAPQGRGASPSVFGRSTARLSQPGLPPL